jgi:iron(III) transport system substrate-binding protein
LLVASLAALVAVLASTATAAHSSATAKGPQPASAAAWKKIIAKAKQEGSVTVYSVQSPTGLQDLANAFKQKYGISVTVNRNVDSVLFSQINAE